MLAIRKIVGTAAGPMSALAAVVGFVTDVLQPLGNFAPWVAGISLLVALVSGAAYWQHWRKPGVDRAEHPLLGVLVVSLAFTLIFGVWSWIEESGPQRGYLAQNVDPIAQIQAQLLGLQKDVTEVKETTQKSATVVASSATAQAQGFKDLQDAFARLSTQGSIVQNPQTPQEWYANARLYQLKGDTANAIKAYEGYFKFNLEFVDPYNEYVALLKATEGIARTRQMIAERFNANKNSQTLDLISARLLDAPAERLQRLTALAARAPQFGPAFLELGQEYDRALQQSPTADLAKKQAEAYNTLFALEQQQNFSRYYIDKVLAERDLTTARKMLDAYANYGKVTSKLDVLFYFYPDGVQLIIVFPEASTAQKLLVSFDDPQPKLDTGKINVGAQSMVNTSLQKIKLPVGDHTLYVQYVDANGVSSPVFNHKFRVDPISVNVQQQPPDFSTGLYAVVFTAGVLGSEASTLYTYTYSIDSPALDKSQLGGGLTAINVAGLKAGDHTLYVRATAKDGGKQTPVVTYKFTVK